MSQLISVSIPLGYTLTITPAADSAGSYWSIGNPGDAPGSVTIFAAGASAIVIGPFDTAATYALQSNATSAAYVLARDVVGNDATVLLPYAPINSPTFTGVPVLPAGYKVGATVITATATEQNYVHGVTSAIQTQMDTKAPSISPSFTTPALGTPVSGNLANCTGYVVIPDPGVTYSNAGASLPILMGYQNTQVKVGATNLGTLISLAAYTDGNALTFTTALNFGGVQDINLAILSYSSLTTLNFGSVITLRTSFAASMASLTTLTATNLAYAVGFGPTAASLTTLSLPALVSIYNGNLLNSTFCLF